jgi:hypothetical protein
MNLSYPIISVPLYQDKPAINSIKKAKKTNKVYRKTFGSNRSNTGVVNNMDQHISAEIVAFINWLADTVAEIREADMKTTWMQKDNKAKISPRYAERMAARKNARKCKQVLQTYNYENLSVEDQKTLEWVCETRSKENNMENIIAELKREELLQEAKQEKEAQDIAQWVISARKLRNMYTANTFNGKNK